jgi:hypothetical protein
MAITNESGGKSGHQRWWVWCLILITIHFRVVVDVYRFIDGHNGQYDDRGTSGCYFQRWQVRVGV